MRCAGWTRCRPRWPPPPRRRWRDRPAPAPPGSRVPHARRGVPAAPSSRRSRPCGPARSSRSRSGQRFEVDTDADAVRRLPGAAHPQPVAVHVLPAPATASTSSGRSPEALVTVTDGEATIHPIAGTRRRGETAGARRRAGRRVGRRPEGAGRARDARRPRPQRPRAGCARPGSVRGRRVRRRSSATATSGTSSRRSAAQVRRWRDAFDVFAASFPAGTLTGAPKVRAMELIEELEPVRRGVYGGAVGYLDAAGDMDMAIAIRTAVMAADGQSPTSRPVPGSSPTAFRRWRSRRPGTRRGRCCRRSRPPRHFARSRRRSRMRERAAFAAALLLTVVGGAGVLLISTRRWQSAVLPRQRPPRRRRARSSADGRSTRRRRRCRWLRWPGSWRCSPPAACPADWSARCCAAVGRRAGVAVARRPAGTRRGSGTRPGCRDALRRRRGRLGRAAGDGAPALAMAVG